MNLVNTNKFFQKLANVSISSTIFQCKPERYSKLYNPAKFTPDKGPFNNYVDKMSGEGQKMSVFVHAQGIKTVHVVVE